MNVEITQRVMDQEEKKMSVEMDNALGLYIPSGVTDETDLRLYDEFFRLCRILYFVLRERTFEEIKQNFIQFYNANYEGKLTILNQMENNIGFVLYVREVTKEDSLDKINEEKTKLYLEMPDERSKANLLYYFNFGYMPATENEVEAYIQVAREIERAVNEQEKVDTEKTMLELEPESVTPEDVVRRYLKGSGLYDPALRNTGFRVDQDIEKK